MLVSRNWLQTFFNEPLPGVSELEEALTFHSCEVESVTMVDGDVILDVKVLPDKSAWLLSHRGIAKELAAILNLPLKSDPILETGEWESRGSLGVIVQPSACDHYEALLIKNLRVGPSPDWLRTYLEVLGQRSINNVVDITNFVMLEVGQPLHAFDANKLKSVGGKISIGARLARAGESITTLAKEEKTLDATYTVIIDANTDSVIAIGGVKGGALAMVDEGTKTIVLESAHFERKAIRQTARRLNLLTDAAKRYENGAPRSLVRPGLALAAKLIVELTGGEVSDFAQTETGPLPVSSMVSVSLSRINSVLGLNLSLTEVSAVWQRLGYEYQLTGEVFSVTPPKERDDLLIPEDLIEEVGRLIGLAKIKSIPPPTATTPRINKRQYYATKLRDVLFGQGFSEVVTSSFRDKDEVRLENALASDKSFLRSSLIHNLIEARERNLPHRDLLGISAVKIFEIGTTFSVDSEQVRLGLAVQTGTTYKAKADQPVLNEAKAVIEEALGVNQLAWLDSDFGVCELDLDATLLSLPDPVDIENLRKSRHTVTYQSFSVYPAVSRDVAFWVTKSFDEVAITELLRQAAGDLCVRLTHLDTFTKDGQTSLAYRLVFQSTDRTLEGGEVDIFMMTVYEALKNAGFTPR